MDNKTYLEILEKLKYCLENDNQLFWEKNWNTEGGCLPTSLLSGKTYSGMNALKLMS